jgi:hypothetical protein
MKKINLSRKQVSYLFWFSALFVLITALISVIGYQIGVFNNNSTFELVRNSIVLYVLLPIILTAKTLQWMGILPRHYTLAEFYTQESYPLAYRFLRYGRIAFSAVIVLVVVILITQKFILN